MLSNLVPLVAYLTGRSAAVKSNLLKPSLEQIWWFRSVCRLFDHFKLAILGSFNHKILVQYLRHNNNEKIDCLKVYWVLSRDHFFLVLPLIFIYTIIWTFTKITKWTKIWVKNNSSSLYSECLYPYYTVSSCFKQLSSVMQQTNNT